eukprot:XP_003723768.1 PREDICTED: RNA-directed DNA polymerase from mobile element jockey-like [Strongylocentrotus purpuratus]
MHEKPIDSLRNPRDILTVPHDLSGNLNVHLWNCNSVRNKTSLLFDHIIDNNVDIMFLTETWLRAEDPVVINECTPAGFTFLNVARGRNDAHGGIAVIYKTTLKLSTVNILSPRDTYELAAVTDPSRSVCYVAIYRPPPSARNRLKTQDFLLEFEELVNELTSHTWKLLIVGDFNVHIDTPDKPDAACFIEIIEEAGLQQHITTPTHKLGHTLDLIISRIDDPLVVDCEAVDKLYSDHYVLSCIIDVARPRQCPATSLCRNFRDLDKDSFIASITEAFHNFPFDGNVDDQVTFYNETVLEVLDQHCPATKRVHRFRSRPPWYTDEIHQARRLRRKVERRWRKSHTVESRQQYLSQVHAVCKLIEREKSKYYTEQLSSADVKNVFHVLNTLLNRSPMALPVDSSTTSLPERFATFFEQKVEKIRASLMTGNAGVTDTCNDDGMITDASVPITELSDFDTVTLETVCKLIRSSPNKTCSLDALPTWLLKENINTFLPYIASIVHTSLSSGVFPSALKEAVVVPLIKKSNLDREDLKNYRPVSNVPFLSKIIEKAALSQLSDHMDEHDLNVENQSAYRRWHSTETALLKVQNDILGALDNRLVTFVVFLDLSAAFDCVDHTILLQRMDKLFGISGMVRSWFDSYLSDRSFRMKVVNELSEQKPLRFGVPQGSVVGPQLFSLYTHPVADIIKHHAGIQHHIYADDVQLYISVDPKDRHAMTAALESLSACIINLQQWMKSNMLKLNSEKTDFLIVASPRYRHLISGIVLTIGGTVIEPSTSIRSLGVEIDANLKLNRHVSSLSSSLHFHLSNIARIRPFLDQSACEHAVRALVSSRIDYANSLLCGTSALNVKRLQRAQNRAAKLVFRAKKYDHVTPFLQQLHWLPVEKRITYKILTITYKCLNNSAPNYLTKLLHGNYPEVSHRGGNLANPAATYGH